MTRENAGEAAPLGAVFAPFGIRCALFEIEHRPLDALPGARLGGRAKRTRPLSVVQRDHRRIPPEAAVKALRGPPRLLLDGGHALAGHRHAQAIRRPGKILVETGRWPERKRGWAQIDLKPFSSRLLPPKGAKLFD